MSIYLYNQSHNWKKKTLNNKNEDMFPKNQIQISFQELV